ncbi:MAG: CHAT domain-containing protein [Chloroflexi bacterium]|nr:CHAT domain-containing protein [Chloroflexota bacterium]
MDPAAFLGRLLTTENLARRRGLLSRSALVREGRFVLWLCAEVDRYNRTDAQYALRLAEVAREAADVSGDGSQRGWSHRAKAHALRFLGEYHACLQEYEEATRLFQEGAEGTEAARTQIGKVDALMYLGRYEEALRTARQTRQLFARWRIPLQAAKLDLNIGNIYRRLGQPHAALYRQQRARRIFRRLLEPELAATTELSIGHVLTELEQFKEAGRAYRRARGVFDAAGKSLMVAMIDTNLGLMRSSQGHYNAALALLSSARETFRSLGISKNVATVNVDLADAYLVLNLLNEAGDLYGEAAAVFRGLGMRYEEGKALVGQAVALGRSEGIASLPLFEAARQLFLADGNQLWPAIVDLHRAELLTSASSASGSLEEACRLAGEAAATFRRLGLTAKEAWAHLVLGWGAHARGDVAAAESRFRTVLEAAHRLDLPWLLYRAYYALGQAQRHAAPLAAKESYTLAIGEVERMRMELQPEDLKTSFLRDKLRAYEEMVLLSLDGGLAEGQAEALEYVERAKSRALLDSIGTGLHVKAKAATPAHRDLAARLQRLREELSACYRRGAPEKIEEGESDDLRFLAAAKEREYQSVLRQIQLVDAEYASLHGVYALGLAEIQRQLEPQQALVEYFIADEEIMAFVVRPEGLKVYRRLSTPARVESLLTKLRFQLRSFIHYGPDWLERRQAILRQTTEGCLGQLYQELVAPLAEERSAAHLIVVPHGILHYLPFHALHDGHGYLWESHQITYAPSATLLALCQGKEQPQAWRPLIVGVPDERLPRVRDEVEAISSLFRSPTVLLDDEATEEAWGRYAGRGNPIHLACHGTYREESPLFSSLKLADGWVTAHDVYNLNLRASLVTLSACETGMSQVAAGDELLGLARGFFHAGTPSLVVSLWPVNDVATADLMHRFYQELRAGKAKAAALRIAGLAIKERYPHPYYWAPFVLMGSTGTAALGASRRGSTDGHRMGNTEATNTDVLSA